MNHKVTETIETLTLLIFQEAFDNFKIQFGGDINKAEKSALNRFKSIISLGNKSRREIVKGQMKCYLDFHEKKDGLETRSEKEQLLYIKARNEMTDKKLNEILEVTKNIIKDSWK